MVALYTAEAFFPFIHNKLKLNSNALILYRPRCKKTQGHLAYTKSGTYNFQIQLQSKEKQKLKERKGLAVPHQTQTMRCIQLLYRRSSISFVPSHRNLWHNDGGSKTIWEHLDGLVWTCIEDRKDSC